MTRGTMLDVFSKYGSFIHLNKSGVTIDDGFDKLNRTYMVLLLCVFSMVITVRQYTGRVISCDGFTKFSAQFAEDYCWTQGLYTIKEAYDQPLKHVPYPGVIPEDVPPCIYTRDWYTGGMKVKCPRPDDVEAPTRLYHLWYQWVPFYFCLAALAFYLPYMFLKSFGIGEIKPLIHLLYNPVETEEELEKTVNKAATRLFNKFCTYVKRSNKRSPSRIQRHKLGLVMIMVKALYLTVSFTTLYLTSLMFEIGDFTTYGHDWFMAITQGTYNISVIRDKIFPKMVACEIKRWGTTGIEEEHGTCVLAPNVINQYLFLILWFALAFLILVNSASILITVACLILRLGPYRKYLTLSFVKDDPNLRKLYNHIGISGRVIFAILATNTGPRVFEDIIKQLAIQLKRKKIIENLDDKPLKGGNYSTEYDSFRQEVP